MIFDENDKFTGFIDNSKKCISKQLEDGEYEKLPLEPTLHIITKNDRIIQPGINAIFSARADVIDWDMNNVGMKGNNKTKYVTKSINASYKKQTDDLNAWTNQNKCRCGYFNATYNFNILKNWYEVRKYAADGKTPINEDNWKYMVYNNDKINGGGGAYSVEFKCYYLDNDTKTFIFNDDIEYENIYTDYHTGRKIHLKNVKQGIPAYAGGQIIFKTNESFPNDNKWINIGFKGVSAPYSSNSNDADNFSCKAYKFNNEHFKSLGNNYYLFNDEHISEFNPLLSDSSNINTMGDYGNVTGTDFNLYFTGPCFFEFNPSKTYLRRTKVDGTSTDYNIFLPNQQIVPELICSVSTIHTINEDTDDSLIVAKPAQTLVFGNSPNKVLLWNTGLKEDEDSKTYLHAETDYGIEYGAPSTVSSVQMVTPLAIKSYCKFIKFGTDTNKFHFIDFNGHADTCKVCNGTGKRLSWYIACRPADYYIYAYKDGNTWNTSRDINDVLNHWSNSTFYTEEEAEAYLPKLPRNIYTTFKSIGPEYLGKNICKNCAGSGLDSLVQVTDIKEIYEDETNNKFGWRNCTKVDAITSNGRFKNLKKLPKTWEGLENLKHSYNLFENAINITELPEIWSEIKPSGEHIGLWIYRGDNMFKNTGITEIKSWTGFRGGSINGIFSYNEHLESLPDDWSDFVLWPNITSESWTANSMFSYCTKLKGVQFNGFNNNSATLWRMNGLFYNCTNLNYIGIDPNDIDKTKDLYKISEDDGFVNLCCTCQIQGAFTNTNIKMNYDGDRLIRSLNYYIINWFIAHGKTYDDAHEHIVNNLKGIFNDCFDNEAELKQNYPEWFY